MNRRARGGGNLNCRWAGIQLSLIRPEHCHARRTPRPLGGHRCRLALQRRPDADRLGHLENYGYVKRLRTSNGEQRILLRTERLNNLASSFMLEARRNSKGLGSLEEKRLLPAAMRFRS